MKNLPGQVGQLALVQYIGAIVKYIYNGTHWVATPETLNYGAPRVADMPIYTSCKQIKLANPKAKDGVYTIDPDGEGGNSPIQAYCDMTTDGGGWTEVFLAQTNNYNSTNIQYTTQYANMIIKNSKEMLFAYTNPSTHKLTNPWKFSPIPTAFINKTPMARGNDTAGSGYATIYAKSLDTPSSSTIKRLLRYGTASFRAHCDEGVSNTWGQICLKTNFSRGSIGGVSGFPLFTSFSVSYHDTCALSNQNYDVTSCSNIRRFIIMVR